MRDVSLGNKDNLSCNLACASPHRFLTALSLRNFPRRGTSCSPSGPVPSEFGRFLIGLLRSVWRRWALERQWNEKVLTRCSTRQRTEGRRQRRPGRRHSQVLSARAEKYWFDRRNRTWTLCFLIGRWYTINLYYSFQKLYKELRTVCLTAVLLWKENYKDIYPHKALDSDK